MQTPLECFLSSILVGQDESPNENRINIVPDNARRMVSDDLSCRSGSSHSSCTMNNKRSPRTPTLQKKITQVSRWESGSTMLLDSPMTSPPLSSGSRSSRMGSIEEGVPSLPSSEVVAAVPSIPTLGVVGTTRAAPIAEQNAAHDVVKNRIRDSRRRGRLEEGGSEEEPSLSTSRQSFRSYHSSAAATNAGMLSSDNADIWSL
jgi:hypothetical protein